MNKVAEIKEAVTALSPAERHELMRWLETEQAGYGDLSEQALSEIGDELFQMLDRGYERIDQKLRLLGAKIERVSE